MIDRAIEAIKAFDRSKGLSADVMDKIALKALSEAEKHTPETDEWAYAFAKAAKRELDAMV